MEELILISFPVSQKEILLKATMGTIEIRALFLQSTKGNQCGRYLEGKKKIIGFIYKEYMCITVGFFL